jgi:hypothetical protein
MFSIAFSSFALQMRPEHVTFCVGFLDIVRAAFAPVLAVANAAAETDARIIARRKRIEVTVVMIMMISSPLQVLGIYPIRFKI